MKLHLGCGGIKLNGYINIDVLDRCGCVDLIHDLRSPLPYEDGSVEEIYCRDLIQHFSREEWKKVKKDWVRVLEQNGVLRIECHDFEYVLKNFTNDTDGKRWGYWLQCIYAGQEDEFDYFKNAFTYEKLVSDLSAEGMERFDKEKENDYFIHLICYKHA